MPTNCGFVRLTDKEGAVETHVEVLLQLVAFMSGLMSGILMGVWFGQRSSGHRLR